MLISATLAQASGCWSPQTSPNRPAQPGRPVPAAQVYANHARDCGGCEHLLRADPALAHKRHPLSQQPVARGGPVEQLLHRVEAAAGGVGGAELLMGGETGSVPLP